MKSLLTLVVIFLLGNTIYAQGVAPGCYCVEGQMRTVAAGEFLNTIEAGFQYSDMPCQTAFAQTDGTNCAACACTDDFNDGGFFQVQTKSLFIGSMTAGYSLSTCDDILETDETLLYCGPCPSDQVGGICDDFVTPDPTDNIDDATPIPTVGEWGVLILCLSLLIFSIAVIREKHLTT